MTSTNPNPAPIPRADGTCCLPGAYVPPKHPPATYPCCGAPVALGRHDAECSERS